jgi:DNA polymerase III sliding clamp (beta) subunit (PCNA family)
MIQVNANLFARVAVAQSTDAARYYLQGVCIQPHPRGEGVTMVATDGNILIAAHDPCGVPPVPAAGIIVSLGKDGLKAARKGKLLMIDPDTGEAIVGGGLWRSPSTTIVDGSFPDWRRVLPSGDLTATGAAFDVKLLSRLGDALTNWRKSSHGLTMRGADDCSPHIIACDTPDAAIFAVCMPIRVTPTTVTPAWL